MTNAESRQAPEYADGYFFFVCVRLLNVEESDCFISWPGFRIVFHQYYTIEVCFRVLPITFRKQRVIRYRRIRSVKSNNTVVRAVGTRSPGVGAFNWNLKCGVSFIRADKSGNGGPSRVLSYPVTDMPRAANCLASRRAVRAREQACRTDGIPRAKKVFATTEDFLIISKFKQFIASDVVEINRVEPTNVDDRYRMRIFASH